MLVDLSEVEDCSVKSGESVVVGFNDVAFAKMPLVVSALTAPR